MIAIRLIPPLHQTEPWAWTLDDRRASTLAAAPVTRWLRVEDGCLWVTARDGDASAPDIWLGRGQSVELPAGTAWVLQAWPQARASLLEAAPQRLSRPSWRETLSRWLPSSSRPANAA